MKNYKNEKQKKLHAAILEKYAVELTSAMDSNRRDGCDKAHADYEARCAEIDVEPNEEYITAQ